MLPLLARGVLSGSVHLCVPALLACWCPWGCVQSCVWLWHEHQGTWANLEDSWSDAWDSFTHPACKHGRRLSGDSDGPVVSFPQVSFPKRWIWEGEGMSELSCLLVLPKCLQWLWLGRVLNREMGIQSVSHVGGRNSLMSSSLKPEPGTQPRHHVLTGILTERPDVHPSPH